MSSHALAILVGVDLQGVARHRKGGHRRLGNGHARILVRLHHLGPDAREVHGPTVEHLTRGYIALHLAPLVKAGLTVRARAHVKSHGRLCVPRGDQRVPIRKSLLLARGLVGFPDRRRALGTHLHRQKGHHLVFREKLLEKFLWNLHVCRVLDTRENHGAVLKELVGPLGLFELEDDDRQANLWRVAHLVEHRCR